MVPSDRLQDALRRAREDPRSTALAVRGWLVRHPEAVAPGLVCLAMAYAAYRLFAPLPAGTWPVLKDSVIFEYIGWYLAEGNRLYIDVWEVKPPLAFEVTALLALLTGGNVALHHSLNLLANGAAIAVGAAAAAGIVHELTGDPLGAVVAGVTPFVLPTYFYRALIGFKSKYFVIAAGLVCLWLAYRERPVGAGVAGAAAVGFWQLAAVFPVAALGYAWQTGGREDAGRVLGAGLATGAVVLLPVVVWGAVPAMIAEVLFTPLLTTQGHTFTDRVQLLLRLLSRSFPVVLLGVVGIASGLAPARIRREWPLALATGWFTFQLVGLDFDRLPDLFPWLAVVSLGVGLVVGHWRHPALGVGEGAGATATDGGAGAGGDDGSGGSHDGDGTGDDRSRRPTATLGAPTGARLFAAALLLFVSLSVLTMGGFGTGRTGMTSPETYDTATELDPGFAGARTYNKTEKQYVYWNRVELPTCRGLGSFTQYKLVNRLGISPDGPWYEAECGQFGPAWEAVREKYL